MKFVHCMSYSKRNNFIKKFYKNWSLETSSRPFCVCKELSTSSIGKSNFWSNLLIFDTLILMVETLMMSAKLTAPDLLKWKVFWNKGYDVIIFANNVTNKIYHVTQIILLVWPCDQSLVTQHFYERSYNLIFIRIFMLLVQVK